MDNCIQYKGKNVPCQDIEFQNFNDPDNFDQSQFMQRMSQEPFNLFEFPENYKEIQSQGNFALQPQQMFVPKYANFHNNTQGLLIYHNLGSGKCHSINTPILMFDGTIKMVQDIQVGEKLMGDDNTPRKVMSLGRGRDQMYTIKTPFGESFGCNSEHILCLKMESLIVHIPVKEYIKLPEKYKSKLMLYKVPIEWEKRETSFNPYHVGRMIVDKNIDVLDIIQDNQIIEEFKLNTLEYRKQMLKGMLNNKSHITIESTSLAKDIKFLINSLGYFIHIENNKKIHVLDSVSSFEVIPGDIDNYYGFTVDKNHRYLLGDFTVTHNTCTSILVGEAYKAYHYGNVPKGRKILVVLPPATVEQFTEELKGKLEKDKITGCVSNIEYKRNPVEYISKKAKKTFLGLATQNKKLQQGQEKSIEDKINKYWEITTHIKFINNLVHPKDEDNLRKYTKRLQRGGNLIIIDEIQNLISESGVLYKKLLNAIRLFSHNNVFVVLSATPIYDKPFEIGLTLNLLNPRVNFPITQKDFKKLFYNDKEEFINKALFSRMCSGYVSYFSGGNPINFPYKRIIHMNHVMEYNQLKAYTIVLSKELKNIRQKEQEKDQQLEQNYLSKTRAFCNIAYPDDYSEKPNKISNKQKIQQMKKQLENFKDDVLKQVKSIYSSKIAKVVEMATKSKGTVLIFSDLVYYGVKPISVILEALGYTSIKKPQEIQQAHKTKGLRFTEWSGENIKSSEKKEYSTLIRELFNDPKNSKGEHLKIVLGTTSIMEGISFKNVRDVHIVNPWWNDSRIKQVIARAIRYKSHSNLPEEERFVNVYKHYSTLGQGAEETMTQFIPQARDIAQKIAKIRSRKLFSKSIDEHIQDKADQKKKLSRDFEQVLKASAVDCNLNRNGNLVRLEENVYYEDQEWKIYYENPSSGKITRSNETYKNLEDCTTKIGNSSNIDLEGIDCDVMEQQETPEEYKLLKQQTENYHNNSVLISQLYPPGKNFLTTREEKLLKKNFVKMVNSDKYLLEKFNEFVKSKENNEEKNSLVLDIIAKSDENYIPSVMDDIIINNKKIPYDELVNDNVSREQIKDLIENAKRLYVELSEFTVEELQSFQ